MAVDNFIPEIWSQNLNLQLRRARAFQNVVNRDWEGEIQEQGDTVHITRPSTIAIRAYAGSVTYDTPTSTQQTLAIDQARYFAFDVDDVDEVQSNVNLVGTYTEEAGQSLANDDDQYIAGLYGGAHADNVIPKAALTADNIYAAFVDASTRLNEKNVPQQGRWAVVSPQVLALLLQGNQMINASDLPENVVRDGMIGQVAGFEIYMSNSVQVANDGVDNVEHNLLGHRAAITFADQLVETEALRREDSFSDAVRGLHLYGAKVVRAEALVDLRRIA